MLGWIEKGAVGEPASCRPWGRKQRGFHQEVFPFLQLVTVLVCHWLFEPPLCFNSSWTSPWGVTGVSATSFTRHHPERVSRVSRGRQLVSVNLICFDQQGPVCFRTVARALVFEWRETCVLRQRKTARLRCFAGTGLCCHAGAFSSPGVAVAGRRGMCRAVQAAVQVPECSDTLTRGTTLRGRFPGVLFPGVR